MAKGRKNKGSGILVFIFLLPLVAIIIYSALNFSQVITLDNVNKVVISAPDTEDMTFESQEDIKFFVDILTSSLSINTAMRDVSEEEPVYIMCEREAKTIEYKFYPSLNLSGCLLIAPDGKLYVLENEKAKQLLLRDEFNYLYSDYFLPTLSVVSGESESVVYPTESTWNYLKSDDKEYSYTPSQYATGEEVYTVLKGLDNTLRFTPGNEAIAYDMTDISYISESGTEYSIKDISELDLSVDTMVSVSFTAKWSSKSGARAYGEAKYKFNLMYDIPAKIEMDVKDYCVGEVITVYASNLNADETVTKETLLNIPNLDFGMIDEDTGVALLPIALDTVPGTYTIKLNTGVDSISETFVITARGVDGWTPIEITTEQYNEMLSPEKLSEFRNIISEATANRPETDYFVFGDGALTPPVSNEAAFVFGEKVNLGLADISGDSGERTCEGLIYETDAGAGVFAAQAGEVVFSDTLAPTGNTIILYHGYGIYTYYFHLNDLELREGTVVESGEYIGTAGMSGFTNGKTVLNFAASIDGIFVDPENFFAEE